MSTRPGYMGGVSIGAPNDFRTLYAVKKWEFEEKANLEDVTPMDRVAEGFGRKSFGVNLTEFSVNIECLLDVDDPHLVADSAEPQTGEMAELYLYMDPDDDDYSYRLEGRIMSVKPKNEVDGQVKWTLNIQGESDSLVYPATGSPV